MNSESESRGEDRGAPFDPKKWRLARTKKVLVLSGKGGVGKSTVAVNLAFALKGAGKKVGLLDIDIHGPSVPVLLGLEGERLRGAEGGIAPIRFDGMEVMSIGFMLERSSDAVIWRGPLKHGVIKQFLTEVVWGELDYLVVDSPPGTGDEPLSVAQLLKEAGGEGGAVIVTTPQELSIVDVRKCVTFCRKLEVPILGIVENMSGWVCPHCRGAADIFGKGGGRRLAGEMEVPFLGAVPIDLEIVSSSDAGAVYVERFPSSAAAAALSKIAGVLTGGEKGKGEETMKFAVPLAEGRLSMHFGHCTEFALINAEDGKITAVEKAEAPAHAPGLLPRWLAGQGVNVVIAGGMGQRAIGLFKEKGIGVVTGAPPEEPEKLVASYLDGTLVTGGNVCEH